MKHRCVRLYCPSDAAALSRAAAKALIVFVYR